MSVVPWRGDDAQLVTALAEGNQVAAAAFFERFSRDVNRLVWRLLGADAEHDDVVQQVFANAFHSIGSVRDAGALSSWIVGVTVNTVRREIRQRRWRRRLFSTTAEIEGPGHVDDYGGREALRRVYAALDRLRPSDRIVLVLHLFDGKTQEAIAEACGCSVPTVKRRMKRGRERFGRLVARDPVLLEWAEGQSMEQSA